MYFFCIEMFFLEVVKHQILECFFSCFIHTVEISSITSTVFAFWISLFRNGVFYVSSEMHFWFGLWRTCKKQPFALLLIMALYFSATIFLNVFADTKQEYLFLNFIDPSADELRRLMMLHGGQYHVYYSRSKTTHIIATNLPNAKIKELKGEKVVRPEWIMER